MQKEKGIVPNSLAYQLVQDGILSESVALEVIAQAEVDKLSFITCLAQKKIISSSQLAQSIAKIFAIPLFDLDILDQTKIPLHLINEKIIQQHHVLPLWQEAQKLFVGVIDPTNQSVLDEMQFQTGCAIQSILVETEKLSYLIEKVLALYHNQKFASAAADIINESELMIIEQDQMKIALEDDAPVVRYVHKILLDAIQKHASDIHFESYEQSYQIRFRIDGLLYKNANPPFNLANRIIARLKIMANLDIAEKRLPQDGRFKIILTNKKAIDFRVSTCPTIFGEKIVLRILDQYKSDLKITSLGMLPLQQKMFDAVLKKPQGMILVTGPTGSGKTLTLYTALQKLNTSNVNICTVEDPIEINMHGINQVNINTKIGLSFANVLRAFLRQDPDIMMIGEIRDLETAEISIKAAQTGHLVLSTLHTNSAAETLTRLINLGIAPYNIATAINLIIAQRLVRRLCNHCKGIATISPRTLLTEGFAETELSRLRIYQPVGCKHCTDGYCGREGLFELLPVTEEISQQILHGNGVLKIAAQTKKTPMKTMREVGLEKVKIGITSLAEINRVV